MSIRMTKHDIGAEIISILTSGMYPDPRDALREYIQNGIDANAQNIAVKIRGSSIIIEDDGDGMDEDTIRNAKRIGISDKNPKIDVGFRGIGIYSSFHLCDNLSIYSKEKKGIPYLLSFDFKSMRGVLKRQQDERLQNKISGEDLVDLQSLLEKHIQFKTINLDLFPKIGTRIEMENLDPNFVKPISKFEDVAEYLRLVVPLHFDEGKFKWAQKIEDKIMQICSDNKEVYRLVNLTLQVNTRTDNLYRPYTDKLFDEEKPQKPQFERIKSKDRFFGIAWGCLNSKRSKIKDKELRGFLLRKQGFAIGRRHDIGKYFGRTTFFDRYVGEIIVVHPDLLPNAPRTDFEFSILKTKFYEALTDVANNYNEKANQYQEFSIADEKLDDAIEGLRTYEANINFFIENPDELIDIIVQIRQIREGLGARIRKHTIRNDRRDEALKALASAKALEKEIQRFINQSDKKAPSKSKTKTAEDRAIARLKKLPSGKTEKSSQAPNSLFEVFDMLSIPDNDSLKIALDLLDERFIQAMAASKAEYISILKSLKDELENLLSEEGV